MQFAGAVIHTAETRSSNHSIDTFNLMVCNARDVPRRRELRPLDAEQLASLAQACLVNSIELIVEAQELLDVGHIPRAYSIAVTAGEEFGKSQLVIGLVGATSRDAEEWRTWWKGFYSHGDKLARAIVNARTLLPEELITSFAAVMIPILKEQRREWGLYVDMVEGVPRSPQQAISLDDAHALIAMLSEVIHTYALISPPNTLRDRFLEAHRGPAQEMRAALDSGNAEVIRTAWERTTGQPIDDALLAWITENMPNAGPQTQE